MQKQSYLPVSIYKEILEGICVDDINLIGTPEELEETANYLKKEFEMKDLGKMRFYLGL